MKKSINAFLLFFTFTSLMMDVKAQTTSNDLKYGKYGCTVSKYVGGTYQYTPKGSFTINKDGTYFYEGFKQKSKGTFKVDKDGNLLFTGGYFNGGKAEKIDRPNKFFLTFPAIPDYRWTCGYVDK
ncbi:hypothetical protein [Pedobacter sp.]|uniref:hypothetical protein n=1 Tax=Pedobacter sp. TaxID=1411316 RepID=UPI00396C4C75